MGGEVKLSISYRNSTLFIMVMHIKDLVSKRRWAPCQKLFYLFFVSYRLELDWRRDDGSVSLPTNSPTADLNQLLVLASLMAKTSNLKVIKWARTTEFSNLTWFWIAGYRRWRRSKSLCKNILIARHAQNIQTQNQNFPEDEKSNFQRNGKLRFM